MRLTNFTADASLYQTKSHYGSLGICYSLPTPGAVQPSMMILVDGVPFCEGVLTDEGVQCFPMGSGHASDGGGPDPCVVCYRNCNSKCHGNTACLKNCRANCANDC